MPMRALMNAEIEELERVIIIRLNDSCDSRGLLDIDSLWEPQLDKKQRTIAIDLCALQSTDLKTIGFFVKFVKKAIFKNREVLFYNVNPSVYDLLAMTGLDKFFDIMTKERFSNKYLD